MMRERMIRWIIAMVLLCGVSHTAAFAYGYNQNAQSKSWGYQSTCQPTYQPENDINASEPSFQFRTTSSYIKLSGDAESGLMSRHNGARRTTSPWDEWNDDENAIGEVPDNVPVGDTPWWLILLLAAGDIAFPLHRQRKAQILRECHESVN